MDAGSCEVLRLAGRVVMLSPFSIMFNNGTELRQVEEPVGRESEEGSESADGRGKQDAAKAEDPECLLPASDAALALGPMAEREKAKQEHGIGATVGGLRFCCNPGLHAGNRLPLTGGAPRRQLDMPGSEIDGMDLVAQRSHSGSVGSRGAAPVEEYCRSRRGVAQDRLSGSLKLELELSPARLQARVFVSRLGMPQALWRRIAFVGGHDASISHGRQRESTLLPEPASRPASQRYLALKVGGLGFWREVSIS